MHFWFFFFLLSEIPDWEKRSEMVVNLKRMGYELNILFHYSLDGVDGSQGASEKNKLKKKNVDTHGPGLTRALTRDTCFFLLGLTVIFFQKF
jgi:hypothetical protein